MKSTNKILSFMARCIIKELLSFSQQPRHPKGSPEGGRWVATGGAKSWKGKNKGQPPPKLRSGEIKGEQTTLVRVQNKEGHGPFRNIKGESWQDNIKPTARTSKARDEEARPERKGFKRQIPGTDIVMDRTVRFACRDMEQLNKFFSKTELAKLKDMGYEVVRVTGELVWESPREVAYIPDKMTNTERTIIDIRKRLAKSKVKSQLTKPLSKKFTEMASGVMKLDLVKDDPSRLLEIVRLLGGLGVRIKNVNVLMDVSPIKEEK